MLLQKQNCQKNALIVYYSCKDLKLHGYAVDNANLHYSLQLYLPMNDFNNFVFAVHIIVLPHF